MGSREGGARNGLDHHRQAGLYAEPSMENPALPDWYTPPHASRTCSQTHQDIGSHAKKPTQPSLEDHFLIINHKHEVVCSLELHDLFLETVELLEVVLEPPT